MTFRLRAVILFCGLLSFVVPTFTQGTLADYQRAKQFLPGNLRHSIYIADVPPHWIDKTDRFWYDKVSPVGSQFIVVDAEHNTSAPAFDHTKLAAALAEATKREISASDLPFDTIEFSDEGKEVGFEMNNARWSCTLADYHCTQKAAEKSG